MEKDERHDDVIAAGSQFYPLVTYRDTGLLDTIKFKNTKDHCVQNNDMQHNISVSSFQKNLMEQLSVKLWLNNARLIHYCVELHSCNNFSGTSHLRL